MQRHAHSSSVKIEKPSVDRVVRAGNETGFVRTQEQGQGGHFPRVPHPAHWLRLGKSTKHFRFTSRIVSPQIVVHELRVDTGRRNAIAPNLVVEVIPGYRKSHGHNGTFAHGIGKSNGPPFGVSIQPPDIHDSSPVPLPSPTRPITPLSNPL